jgi:hypothetical protein
MLAAAFCGADRTRLITCLLQPPHPNGGPSVQLWSFVPIAYHAVQAEED